MVEPPSDPRDALIADLRAQIEQQKRIIDKLTARVQELERVGKRQAAPFSKGSPKPDPKTPGRKSGTQHGVHAHRAAPEGPPDEIYRVPLPCVCPHCQSSDVLKDGTVSQFQTELPAKPIIRRFDIATGRCSQCQRRVQGRHPLQTSDATGAAGSQLGAHLQAFVVLLHKRLGLSCGKVTAALKALQIDISRGAVAQVCLRAADRCMPAFLEITQAIQHAPVLVPDETGWRIGGRLAWLHVLVSPDAVLFAVWPNRSGEVFDAVVGRDFAGRLTCDGWIVYEKLQHALRQSCLAHLLSRVKELLWTQAPGAAQYPLAVKSLLQEGLALRDARDAGAIPLELAQAERQRLTEELHDLTRHKKRNADNERLAKYLSRNETEVFAFLADPQIPATNHWTEQQIRFGVVNRKVWGGNRTENGAWAQSVLSSILATAIKQGKNAMEFLAQTLRAPPHAAPSLFNSP